MIEKNKTYTYEEIKEIYTSASAKAIKNFNEDYRQVLEKENKEDSIDFIVFCIQNLMLGAEIASKLFEKENEVNKDGK